MTVPLSTITLGTTSIGKPVLLAPICGVSDAPFRYMVNKFSPNLTYSEMLVSQAVMYDIRGSKRKILRYESVSPFAVQLAGYEPVLVAEAAKINEDEGVSLIDLNFGCPAKKIVNNFIGSALMKDEERAVKIVEAVVKAVKIPVTVKMRKGWDDDNLNAASLAKKVCDAGAQMITVHGRTRCQLFNGAADWKFIEQVKSNVNVPVIVNGDIKNSEDAKKALFDSRADGVMVARGSYGKPWIIKQISDELDGIQFTPPTDRELRLIIEEHMHRIVDFYGDHADGFMKKHLGFYTKGLPYGSEFRAKVMQLDKAEDILVVMKGFFNSVGW